MRKDHQTRDYLRMSKHYRVPIVVGATVSVDGFVGRVVTKPKGSRGVLVRFRGRVGVDVWKH